MLIILDYSQCHVTSHTALSSEKQAIHVNPLVDLISVTAGMVFGRIMSYPP